MDEKKIRVMVVDDSALLRLGLKMVLDKGDFSLVAESENGEQAVAQARRLDPDLILMDVDMPIMNGIEAARLIRGFNKDVKIIMLTSLDSEEIIHSSLAAGANGYCLKETKPDILLTALKCVMDDDIWIDPTIADKVLRSLLAKRSDVRTSYGGTPAENQLSSAEFEVLHLIVEGMLVREIADKLDKSEQHIRDIKSAILERLSTSARRRFALNKLRDESAPLMPKPTKHCLTCGRKCSQDYRCCPYDGTRLEEIIADELTGTVFADRFEIISRLGRGGMSVVYKARHRLLGRIVAIKLLDPLLTANLLNARRFREEALASSLLQHPNLISISDFGLTPSGEPFLVMDYICGESLIDIISGGYYIGTERAVSIFIQVCDGIWHAHSRGVIHRDLKPSNIMLVPDENTGKEMVKVIDFGIAKMVTNPLRSQDLSQRGETLGSPIYMSPEQCNGLKLDERSDVYSFGCTMYEVLSGRVPLKGKTGSDTMQLHLDTAPIPLRELVPERNIPVRLDQIVMKALCKDPSDRYQSMDAMKQDLSQALGTNNRMPPASSPTQLANTRAYPIITKLT